MSAQIVLSRDGRSPTRKKTQKHHLQSYWINIIEEYTKSSLPAVAFCQEKGLAVSTFHKWRQRLRSGGSMDTHNKEKKEQQPFLPVYVTPPKEPLAPKATPMLESNHSSGVSLLLRGTLRVTLDKEFHEPTLQRLLQLLSKPSALHPKNWTVE